MYSCSCSVVSDSLPPHGLQPTRLLCSWNIPGKNTGVGFYFLLQGIFPTQGLKPCLLCLLRWQADSLYHYATWEAINALYRSKYVHMYLSKGGKYTLMEKNLAYIFRKQFCYSANDSKEHKSQSPHFKAQNSLFS